MANQVLAIRLVQWLGWVFETQERKKRKRGGYTIRDWIWGPIDLWKKNLFDGPEQVVGS